MRARVQVETYATAARGRWHMHRASRCNTACSSLSHTHPFVLKTPMCVVCACVCVRACVDTWYFAVEYMYKPNTASVCVPPQVLNALRLRLEGLVQTRVGLAKKLSEHKEAANQPVRRQQAFIDRDIGGLLQQCSSAVQVQQRDSWLVCGHGLHAWLAHMARILGLWQRQGSSVVVRPCRLDCGVNCCTVHQSGSGHLKHSKGGAEADRRHVLNLC